MSNMPSSSSAGNMVFFKNANEFTAEQRDSSAYTPHGDLYDSAMLAPCSTNDVVSVPGMYHAMPQGAQEIAPPMPGHPGSPHDVSQHCSHQHAEAVNDNASGYESIQGTNSIMAPLPPPSLAQQNQAIFALLETGTTPELAFHCVESFKHMVLCNDFPGLAFTAWSGNFRVLAIIAVIPTEELYGRILHVVHLSAAPTVEPRPNGKRESLHEETSPRPQASKRPRTSSNGKDAARKAITREGCPWNGWTCEPEVLKELKGKWGKKENFVKHFKAEHLQACSAVGGRWQCPLCKIDPFKGNGSQLMKHLWKDHF